VVSRIAIVGLGRIGSSIGLALKEKKGARVEIVGHDKDHNAARSAHKSGCVDRTDWNLISACDGADLIVLSTPLTAIKSTLQALAAELKPGCVVTDTASLKVPVLNWAHELLPAGVHFVGGHPILANQDVLQTGAELFAGAVYCLTPTTSAPPDAIQRASDLVEAVGAKPYYMDAAEHDGLIAAVEQLPLLMALALQDVVSASPSHREIAQLSGADFGSVTEPLAGGVHGSTADQAKATAEVCGLNAANIARWLDAFLAKLSSLRESVALQDSQSLQQAIASALEARALWRRQEIEGEATDYSDFGMQHQMLGDLFRQRKAPPERGRD
jgi:prephenate dehydrogenase